MRGPWQVMGGGSRGVQTDSKKAVSEPLALLG